MPDISPEDAAAMLAQYLEQEGAAVEQGLRVGMRVVQRAAVTPPSMVGLGVGKNARPPNPPPGPLGIRSGNLRRTVDIIPPRRLGPELWESGLKAGSPTVLYARIQELGGTAGRGGRSRIPARPYLRPAIERNMKAVEQAVERELLALIRKIFG